MIFGSRSTSSTGRERRAQATPERRGCAAVVLLAQRRDHQPERRASRADHERRALPSEREHEDGHRRACDRVPSGTPVCLMEKVSASIPGGARAREMTELGRRGGP
jgi:hypothetical protein